MSFILQDIQLYRDALWPCRRYRRHRSGSIKRFTTRARELTWANRRLYRYIRRRGRWCRPFDSDCKEKSCPLPTKTRYGKAVCVYF